jgi:hypothetical protein
MRNTLLVSLLASCLIGVALLLALLWRQGENLRVFQEHEKAVLEAQEANRIQDKKEREEAAWAAEVSRFNRAVLDRK